MATTEEYAEMMEAQVRQYQAMIDQLIDRQQKQVETVIGSVISKKEEPKAEVSGNITSVWITGEDGEQYLLMSKDAANLLFEAVEKTASGLQAIAKDVA